MNAPHSAPWFELEQAVTEFTAVRQRLFGIAYRIVGNSAGAEDIVQDAWIRWQNTDRTRVQHPAAYLATTTEHLAINEIQSAHTRYDIALDPLQPTPLHETTDPELSVERAEAIEQAMTILVERLTPRERAAYVLRVAFGYPYERIALVVRASEPAARQLVSRAQRRLTGEHRVPAAGRREQSHLVAAFRTAVRSGDVATLEGLFRARRRRDIRSADVTMPAPVRSGLISPNEPPTTDASLHRKEATS